MNYCTNCGTPQESGSRFCTGCGKQVSAELPTPMANEDDGWATDPPTRPGSRGRFVAALTTLALLLGVGGVTAWATLTHDTDPPAPPNPSPSPQQTQVETSTSQATEPPGVNAEDAARDWLTRQISLDRPQVRSELAETWAAQLSSKRPGLVVDGVTYGYTEILNDHLALKSIYSARLVWSGDWSSFGEGDFYITVATVPFSTPTEANAWCDMQAIDSDNCFAKRLSSIVGPDGSTVNR